MIDYLGMERNYGVDFFYTKHLPTYRVPRLLHEVLGSQPESFKDRSEARRGLERMGRDEMGWDWIWVILFLFYLDTIWMKICG